LIYSRAKGVCHFSVPTVCTKVVLSRYFEYNKRFGSYSLFQNDFIHEIRAYATFLLLQFVRKWSNRGIMRIINVLAPTDLFKIDSFTSSGIMQVFCSESLYQSCFSRYFEYKKHFGSYSLFRNDSFTRTGSMTLFCSYSLYQTCLVQVFCVHKTVWLLQFVSKWIHKRDQRVCQVSAPIVCTKLVDSSCFEYNKLFGSYRFIQN